MGFHTYDHENAAALEQQDRYRYLSAEELLALLRPESGSVVADLGSGTGFYTDDVAPHVGTLYAVDVQEEMHAFYREKGVPENVSLVTANVEDLPFADAELDAAFSTMTFHEFANDAALAELARVLEPGGRLVVVDWTANGSGDDGPPLTERYICDDAVAFLEANGFEVERAEERLETFVVVGERRA